MKFLLAVLAVMAASFIYNSEAVVDEKTKLALLNKCQGETNASGDDVALVKRRKVPGSREGKCLLACIYSQAGFGSMKDGLLDFKGIEKFLKIAVETQEQIERAVRVAGRCAASEGLTEDPCENAAKYNKCFIGDKEFADIAPLVSV